MPAIPSNLMGFESTPLALLTDAITEFGFLKATEHVQLFDVPVNPRLHDQF